MDWWDTSCPDWEERIRRGQSLVPNLPLIQSEAQDALAFFDEMRLPDVPGQPRFGDLENDWFRPLVAACFGSYDPTTETRFIRNFFFMVAKKNGKSAYSAALMVTAMLMNRRQYAEYIIVGPTQEVSTIAFKAAAQMILISPDLSKRFKVTWNVKEIFDRVTKSTLKVKTFDATIVTGSKPAGVLIDEFHLLGPKANAAEVLGQLTGGAVTIPDAFFVTITTQSDHQPVGVFDLALKEARGVRDGTIRAPLLPVIYEFPSELAKDKEAWKDTANWHLVNPNLGRSIKLPQLVELFEKAQRDGEQEIRRWASQHLNVQIGVALGSDAWAGAEFWDAQVEEGLTLEGILDLSDCCVVGIDGGGLDDLLALAVLGRDKVNPRHWRAWSRAWAHPVVLERRKGEAEALRSFEKDGDLRIIERVGEDITEVVAICQLVDDTGKLALVGMDPYGVGAIVDALSEVGISNTDEADSTGKARIQGVSQGYRLQGAIKTGERKLAEGTLTHCGQRLMAWAVGNAKIEQSGNAIVITKQTAGSAKIDPLLALLDAVALMTKNPVAYGQSIYDQSDEVEGGESSGKEVSEPGGQVSEDGIDMSILSNPRHPRWHEMRERYERQLSLQDASLDEVF